jgi:hypothetical protein
VRTGALLATVVALPLAARANPAALVPTLFPPGDHVGVQGSATSIFATIDYAYEDDRADIRREGTATSANAPIPLGRDLVFRGARQTITPRLEIGLLQDTWIYGALPVVVTQSRELRFDHGVDAAGSSTVRDGLVPASGYDAQDPTAAPAGTVFRGVDRHGLDQAYVGLGVAPMNQTRDDTKPTWKLGAEARLAVGKVMRFDPTAPTANAAVGAGVHELRLWTTFDRRLGWAEPWLGLFWQVPLATRSSSLFQNPGFGATNTDKAQLAGVWFGLDAYAVNTPSHDRVAIELGASATAHFEGRDYSELWELFAYAGSPTTGGPLVLDSDPVMPGTQAAAHPGITNVENFLETSARLAVRGELGQHVQFAAIGDLVWRSDHVITFTDAGVDRNGDDLVNPGTSEVNPLHVDRIDLVGHRYHAVHGFGVIIGVSGQVLF